MDPSQGLDAVRDVAFSRGTVAAVEESLGDSSDLHIRNYNGPVFDQLTVLSKFLWLGMPLFELVRLSTETTAGVMGVSDRLGTLRVGAEGDATIMRLDDGRFTLTDGAHRSVTANQRLTHVQTIKAGRVYNPWLR